VKDVAGPAGAAGPVYVHIGSDARTARTGGLWNGRYMMDYRESGRQKRYSSRRIEKALSL